jgi:hypothetical protein
LQRAGIALARNLPGKDFAPEWQSAKIACQNDPGEGVARGVPGHQKMGGRTHFFSFHHITERWAKRLHWQIGAGQDAQLRPDLEHVPTSCAYKNACGKTCTNNDFKGLPTNP